MSRRLTCGSEHVHLTDPQLSALIELVSRAPNVVSPDDLAKAGLGRGASGNNVQQVVSRLRKALAKWDQSVFIVTVANRGYRFVAPIEQRGPATTLIPPATDDELLRVMVQGDRDLPTLRRDSIEKTRRGLERNISKAADYAPAHARLAHTCALAFDDSRVDTLCDMDALARALEHGRLATELDPLLADGWSAFGFALYLNGDIEAAAIATLRAVKLDRDGWRHWLLRSYVTCGDERREAAHMTLTLFPNLAFGYWLKATGLIPRGALEAALIVVIEGCRAQDKQVLPVIAYPGVGLHLLHGLLLAAMDRLDEAVEEFRRELAAPDRGQIYGRECLANTWYSFGAVRRRQGDVGAAHAAFRRALEIAPAHFNAMAALGQPIPVLAANDPRLVSARIAHAILLSTRGQHRESAAAYREAVLSSNVPNAGWILPVEPIIHVSARPEIWGDVLAIIQQRAS